jgi:hypothetical protein
LLSSTTCATVVSHRNFSIRQEIRPHVRALVLLRRDGAGVVLRAGRQAELLRHAGRRRAGPLWLRRRLELHGIHRVRDAAARVITAP